MSSEMEEFLHGLYDYHQDTDNGPYVNWTAGFEPSPDECAAWLSAEGDDSRLSAARTPVWAYDS